MRIVLRWAAAWIFATGAAAPGVQAAPSWSYGVVATYPHDATAFTEGLVLDRGRLIESTGRYGQSALTIRELKTGRVLKSMRLDARDFGEGVAVVGRKIFQLTWKAGIGYVYDFDLQRTGSFDISSEGWGLTYDGRELIRSDGSATLRVLDPKTFRETRRIWVHDGLLPVEQLNELEYVNGRIYANVWQRDRIAVIDARSGVVDAWLDLSTLKSRFPKPADWNDEEYVLNGIAYDARNGHLLVTGKCWPALYEIAIDPRLKKQR